jgi:hypothetical protein
MNGRRTKGVRGGGEIRGGYVRNGGVLLDFIKIQDLGY